MIRDVRSTRPLPVRIGLAILGVPLAMTGAWAAFAPRSFYDHFPGGGHAWVSADGPYNQHLVRDFGQLNLGFVVLFAVVAVTLERHLLRAVLGAYLVPAVLHLIYHLNHLGLYGTSDAVGNVTGLSLAVVLPIAIVLIDAAPPSVRAAPAARSNPSARRAETGPLS
jgi:hypothetical protein